MYIVFKITEIKYFLDLDSNESFLDTIKYFLHFPQLYLYLISWILFMMEIQLLISNIVC